MTAELAQNAETEEWVGCISDRTWEIERARPWHGYSCEPTLMGVESQGMKSPLNALSFPTLFYVWLSLVLALKFRLVFSLLFFNVRIGNSYYGLNLSSGGFLALGYAEFVLFPIWMLIFFSWVSLCLLFLWVLP